MTQNELVAAFEGECQSLAELVAAKNSNYSGVNGNGAFHNFGLIEHITGDHISREAGAVVRMTDKLARIWALVDGNPDVVGESFGDTCRDLAGYALLLKLMWEEKHPQTATDANAPQLASDNGGVELAGVSGASASLFDRAFGGLRGFRG